MYASTVLLSVKTSSKKKYTKFRYRLVFKSEYLHLMLMISSSNFALQLSKMVFFTPVFLLVNLSYKKSYSITFQIL